ncbi:MAG: 50S ribosome-binding GTPase, partial [Chloroflexota bacterium]|nr:50S ribosome-binding GTPase [Chloroflexota bacterium]
MSTKYPKRLDDLRRLLDAVGVDELRAEFNDAAPPRLAIVGPVNAGKSTLFNAIAGAERSAVSPLPGTTTAAVEELVGPLRLVDTPGAGEPGDDEHWGAAWQHVVAASVVVLVLDAAAGLRQADVALWQAIAALDSPALVTLNKIDLLRAADLTAAVSYVEQQLGTRVIPISAARGTNVAELLMPALLDLEPTVTVALGRALPGFRRAAAERIVREAAGLSAAAGAEPVPFVDIPLVLAAQIRMVLRVAAIYGETLDAERAKEIIGAVMGGMLVRTAARQVARLVPVVGWAAAGGVAAAGTYALGRATIEYFASGKTLGQRQLRDLYHRMLRQPPPADLVPEKAQVRRQLRDLYRWMRRQPPADLAAEPPPADPPADQSAPPAPADPSPDHTDQPAPAEVPSEPRRSFGRRRMRSLYRRVRRKQPSADLTDPPEWTRSPASLPSPVRHHGGGLGRG